MTVILNVIFSCSPETDITLVTGGTSYLYK